MPRGMKPQAFPQCPATWAEQIPSTPGQSHPERQQIREGSLRWEAVLAAGELRGGLERCCHGNLANIIDTCNPGKPRAVPFPQMGLSFRTSWTPGKSTFFSPFSPPFLLLWISQPASCYLGGERLGHTLRVSQRCGGLSA